MTPLEITLWIVAGIVITEIFYIIICNLDKKEKKEDKFGWGFIKFLSISSSLIIIGINLIFLGIDGEEGIVIHYERLLYELGIILSLVIFFGGNYLLYKLINKKRK